WPRAFGLVASKTWRGPIRNHWPANGGYLLASNGSPATGAATTHAASAHAPMMVRNGIEASPSFRLQCLTGGDAPDKAKAASTAIYRHPPWSRYSLGTATGVPSLNLARSGW